VAVVTTRGGAITKFIGMAVLGIAAMLVAVTFAYDADGEYTAFLHTFELVCVLTGIGLIVCALGGLLTSMASK
jgi:hypothetical protein